MRQNDYIDCISFLLVKCNAWIWTDLYVVYKAKDTTRNTGYLAAIKIRIGRFNGRYTHALIPHALQLFESTTSGS